MKFYSSHPNVGFLKIKEKKKIRKFPLALIGPLMLAIIYYPYQYGRMLAYGIADSYFFPDWRGALPQVIIIGTAWVILSLISIIFIKYIARSKTVRVTLLCIFFLILEILLKKIIVYFTMFLIPIRICILLYNVKKDFKYKRLIYLFDDLTIMALWFFLINIFIYACSNDIRVIFSNEIIMALIPLFCTVFFISLYIAFPIYYLVDKNTYKNILVNVFNIKLESILNIIEDIVTKSEITLLLFLVLFTGFLSILIGFSNPNVFNRYLVNSKSYIDVDHTVEVVVYESGEYYCLEAADLSPENDNLLNLIIYKDSYRWIRKDAIQTRLICVSSSRIQDYSELKKSTTN